MKICHLPKDVSSTVQNTLWQATTLHLESLGTKSLQGRQVLSKHAKFRRSILYHCSDHSNMPERILLTCQRLLSLPPKRSLGAPYWGLAVYISQSLVLAVSFRQGSASGGQTRLL